MTPDSRRVTSVDVTTNKTLTAADQGIIQNVVVDGLTITLPSTAAGLGFTIRNGGAKISANGPVGAVANKGVLVKVAPAAADAIAGNGFTATVNKAALNTKATSVVGDQITVYGSGTAGVSAWNLRSVTGTWVREA